ncbi:protein timeless homolog [Zonotrichia leucophrys gambelii]|uniref:protein timeless homolog n=1 Tax=Zonotrichia leucophrys gambelii TaxID=257770 RepID=UPI00314023F2
MDWYMMNCELLATCSALGYLEGDVYHREPDCLESVKDLIRYLRHEDETRDVRQQLGAAQILQNDLLPILVQYPQEKVLFDAVIRLMVNLTQPALLCFGKVPADATSRHHFLQVLSYLQAYKEAFANEKVFGVLSEKLYNLLQLDWEQRQEEDTLLIERILLLVRNVLHVPPDPTEEQGVDGDASVHDRVLWALHISGMDDLLKFLASAQVEQQWALHVLEIISLMFREQSPEELAAMGQGTAGAEHGEDTRELQSLRQREMAEKRSRALQRTSRHSRFGGSYVLQGVKSIGDRDVVFHKGLHNLKSYSHDLGKEPRRLPRRRQPAPEAEPSRRSARNVRLFLRRFCQDFLQDCYNRLMLLVKDQLVREKAQQHDETYYLWATSFFMCRRFACAPVVRALVLLLRGYARNSARTNHCAARLLHRLARELRMEPLLFQLSLFALFHRLLSDPAAAAHQELVTLAKFIVGKFFALAATNKKAFVELLFWKSPAIVGEMSQGYSSLQEGEGTTRSRVPPWTPQEEQELRELYWKYKEMEGGDIIAAILAQLPSPGRTRRQVVKQLVRMGLASSAKDFPRERKGTRIVLWTQEQEEELTRLFEEFQGSDDVLGNIMKHLTARRSRARVVEKLLGLGLVAERKELYKKRRRKSQGHGPGQAAPGVPAMPAQDSSGEDEDSEEEEEEDEDDEGLTEEHWVPEEGAGQDLAQHLHGEGLAGPLRWLQNCLRRAAEDREEDGVSHPVPLVPLTEENEDAMEDRRFRNLLRQLGLRPPASEQESFWRIPAALTPQQLRRAAASIAHRDPPASPQNLPEPPRCPQDGAAEPPMAALGSDSESEEPVPVPIPVPSPVLARTKRRRELASEDEDEDEDGGSSATDPPPPAPRSEEDEDEDEEDPQPRGRRKRIRCLEEEEEDD